MAQYADRIAEQFVQGLKVNRHASLYEGGFELDSDYRGGVKTSGGGSPRALYSYGPHYPLVIQATSSDGSIVGYWVNETPYYVTEEDKYRSGFGQPSLAEQMGLIVRKPRKPSPSPTTRGHRSSVEAALRKSEYKGTAITRQIETEGTDGEPLVHTLRLWA
jgi:hypothetical protein